MTEVVTELTVDARGAQTGSAQYIEAMRAAQAAVDRYIDRQRAMDAATAAGGAVMQSNATSVSRAARSWESLRASIDPNIAATREIERATVAAENAVRLLGVSSADAARALDAVRLKHDAAAQAAKRQADEYARLATEGRAAFAADQAQRGFNTTLGIRDPSMSSGSARASASVFEEAARDAEKYQRSLTQLRATLDPIAVAQDRLNAELSEYSVMAAKGDLSTTQLAQAQLLARGRFEATTAAIDAQNAVAGRQGRGAQGAANFSAGQQFQDIAMMAALGQSPIATALQQGPQLASAVQMGGGISALGAGLASLVSPTMLLTIGTVGLAAAVTQLAVSYGGKLFPAVKTFDDAISAHDATIKRVKETYGDLFGELEKFESRSGGLARALTRQDTATIGAVARTESRSFLDTVATLPRVMPSRESILRGLPPGRNSMFRVDSEYEAFSQPITELYRGIALGAPNFRQFIDDVERLGAAGDTATRKLADGLIIGVQKALEMNGLLAEQKQILDGISQGMPYNARTQAEQNRAAYSLENTNALAAERARFNAAMAGIGARSPQQLADDARRREAAQPVTGRESPELRRFREDSAAALAYAEAIHGIREAQEQRLRSLDATLAAQRLDIDLIGKTAGEAARLRMEFDLTAQVREDAARNGIAADEKELALIRQKAEEYGRLVDMQQRAELGRDLGFERAQLFRNPVDQQIASRLRGTGLGLDSPEAGYMRETARLAELKGDVQGFFTDFTNGALRGGKSLGEAFADAAKNAALRGLDRMLESAFDSLWRALMGAAGVDMGSGAGFGGAAAAVLGAAGGPDYSAGAVTRAPLTPAGGVAAQAWNFFAGKGLKPHQIAGIMGNVQAESSFRPSAVGDGGDALGLFQWNDRRNAMTNFVGSDWRTDVDGQLRFAWHELQTSESAAMRKLMAAPDVRSATAAFGGFERASGWSAANPEAIHNFSGRLRGAEDALRQFGGTAGAATQGLSTLNAGLANMGNNLSTLFPPAPALGGGADRGGFGGLLSGILGGALSPSATRVIAGNLGGLYANGAAFLDGSVIPFGDGGVVTRPTRFAMSNGRTGEMGEAGEEAIMPLRRDARGRLGVTASGGAASNDNSVHIGDINVAFNGPVDRQALPDVQRQLDQFRRDIIGEVAQAQRNAQVRRYR